jgi:hypothetical protein
MGSLGSYSRALYQFREHRPETLCGIAHGLAQPIDGDVDPCYRRPQRCPPAKTFAEVAPEFALLFPQGFFAFLPRHCGLGAKCQIHARKSTLKH